MSKERIGKFIETQDQVIGAWLQYLTALGDFQCFSSDKQTVINETGAHIIDRKPRKCNAFCADVECEDKTCSHKPYNTHIVYLFNELKKAKHERNMALLDLFGLKTRMINVHAYRQLKKEKKIKSKEVFGLYCEYTIADGAEAINAQEKYEGALKEYDKLVAKCTDARRKVWGRNK